MVTFHYLVADLLILIILILVIPVRLRPSIQVIVLIDTRDDDGRVTQLSDSTNFTVPQKTAGRPKSIMVEYVLLGPADDNGITT